MPVASAMWASYDVGGYVYILCWLLYHACEPRASVIKHGEVWSRSTPNSSKPPERMRGPSMILWLRDSGTRYMSYMMLYVYNTHTTYNYISSRFILEPLILNLGHHEVIHRRMWPDETCFHDLSWVVYP